MTDPRLIALSSNPGQVEPGPFSEHDLREQWNAQADEFNQWESLDSCEQLAWAQTRAVASVQFASLMQEPAGPSLEEVGPLISWLLEAAIQSANAKAAGMLTWAAQVVGQRVDEDAPDADQAEGPSLADVDELCKEFGFHYADGETWALGYDDTIEVLQEMITAAITRWRASVAQPVARPVDMANVMRLVEGVDPLAPGEPDVDHILTLAAIIREVDGRHDLGAAALAEAILAHLEFSDCHDGPAALPAQGEVAELLDFLDSLAASPILTLRYSVQLRRVAELLKGIPALQEAQHSAPLPQGEEGEASGLSDEYLVRVYQQAYEPALKRGEAFGCHWDGLRAVYNLGQKQAIGAIPKGIPALPAPGFQIGPQEYIPHA